MAAPVITMVYVPGGVFSTVGLDPPPPPPPLLLPLRPQLTRKNAARTIGSQTILIHRGLRNGRTSTKQDESAVPAPNQARICQGACVSLAAVLVKVVVIVSVAEATLFKAADAGVTLQERLVEDGVQLRLSVPLKLFTEARFRVTVPLLPPDTVICGTTGTTAKSPTVWVTVRLSVLLVDDA